MSDLIKSEKRGRPCLLTPKLRDEIAAKVKEIKYLSPSANACGLNERTAQRWMKVGRLHEEKFHPEGDDCDSNCDEEIVAYRAFYNAIKKAEAEFIEVKMNNIDKYRGKGYWMAQAWQLERTMPDKFGLKTRTEHTGEGGGPIKHSLSLDRRQAVLNAAQKSLTIDTEQDEDGTYIPVQDND